MGDGPNTGLRTSAGLSMRQRTKEDSLRFLLSPPRVGRRRDLEASVRASSREEEVDLETALGRESDRESACGRRRERRGVRVWER